MFLAIPPLSALFALLLPSRTSAFAFTSSSSSLQTTTTTSRRIPPLSQRHAVSDAEVGVVATTKNDDDNNDVLSQLASAENTQTKLSPDEVSRYESAIAKLPPPPAQLDVNGGWRLLATISPEAAAGDNVDFFDVNSWRNYVSGTGPSPFQSLVTGSSRVGGLTQWLSETNFDNVVEFKLGPIDGTLVLKALLEGVENNKRIFRFEGGFFLLKTVWGSLVTLPYPVPFRLLGDRAVGWLDTIGYDDETGFRAAVGNKGTKFIFQRNTDDVPEDIVAASQLYATMAEHESVDEERERNAGLAKRAVIICPQQFGGKPGDYQELGRKLRERGHPVYLARLSALDWLSITKSVFTEAYWKGKLEPSAALPFYMNAINDAVARMEENDAEFTILSHSIGGWVARAWLGEVADDNVRSRCRRFVSLGTPHIAPPEGSLVAMADQTRGLLSYVNERWPGAYWDGVKYTCVASKEVKGAIEVNLDSLLGYVSYFALIGEGGVDGDGITPVTAALLDGADHIVLDGVYHADVLPNPIGGRNTKLLKCKWYADKIDDWIAAL